MNAKSGSKRKTPSAYAAKVSARKGSAKKSPAPAEPPAAKKPTGAAKAALSILEDESWQPRVVELGEQMMGEVSTTATRAARVVHELATRKAESVVPIVDKLARGLTSPHKRVVQTSADALPVVARVAPARVARQLDVLRGSFDNATDIGKDGLVRTFAALCTASVAYQKRLEPVLTRALDQAPGKTLLAWTEVVLPALKGEPHARARAVVERRIYQIPRSVAQKIADFLGVKLRHSFRGS